MLLALIVEGYLEELLIIKGVVTIDLFEEWFKEKVLL
jgi:hypothetical protein